jgi:SulP family sulfate permease
MAIQSANTGSLQQHAWLVRVFPFLNWTPMVTRDTMRADFWAGLTGAIVVLPQGVAFATIAGMPPEYGLYAGVVPAIIAALFGSSWHLVSGPTTAASVVLFSSLSNLAQPGSAQYVGLALTLAFMVGMIQLVMGFARLGAIVNFISHSVVIGFTAGAAVLIMFNQVKNFFALDIERGAHPHEVVVHFINHLSEIGWPTVAVGVITMAAGIGVRRYAPKWPYMIIAILVGSVAGVLLNMFEGADIKTVGALPASLPPLSAPSFDYADWRKLAPTVAAVTMFALTEAISISRALAARSGQHIDANQEFIGQGLSNIVGSFFSAYVATGSFNRSGLNYESGAKTPMASVIAGVLLAGIVLIVAPLAVYMPNAAMAGVLFIVAWGLIDTHHIHQIVRTSKTETVVLAVTFLSAIFLELEFAIFAGVMLSLLLYLHRTANPSILIRVPDPNSPGRKFETVNEHLPECRQVRIIRFDGALFFGAANTFVETLLDYEKNAPEQIHLIIVMSGVNFIDVTGAEALVQMAKRYRTRGGGIYLIKPKDAVIERLTRGGYIEEFGRKNIFTSKTDALRTVYRHLNYDMCRECRGSVFVECRRMGKQEPREEDFDEASAPPSAS